MLSHLSKEQVSDFSAIDLQLRPRSGYHRVCEKVCHPQCCGRMFRSDFDTLKDRPIPTTSPTDCSPSNKPSKIFRYSIFLSSNEPCLTLSSHKRNTWLCLFYNDLHVEVSGRLFSIYTLHC
jgi:hypothetical protein